MNSARTLFKTRVFFTLALFIAIQPAWAGTDPKRDCSWNFAKVTQYSLRTALAAVAASALGLGWFFNSGDEIGLPKPTAEEHQLLETKVSEFRNLQEVDAALEKLIPRIARFIYAASEFSGRESNANRDRPGAPPRSRKQFKLDEEQAIRDNTWAILIDYVFANGGDTRFSRNLDGVLQRNRIPDFKEDPDPYLHGDTPRPTLSQVEAIVRGTLKEAVHSELKGSVPKDLTLKELLQSEFPTDTSDLLSSLPDHHDYRRKEVADFFRKWLGIKMR